MTNRKVSSAILSIFFVALCSCFFMPAEKVYAAASTWTGAVSTDWGTAGNWSPSGVPDYLADVTIPDAGTTNNDPNISVGAICNNLTIAANGVLNGNGNTIAVESNWINSGTFNHGNGKILFEGWVNSAFTPGSSQYNNIELDKFSGDWGADHLSISGTATVSGNLTQTNGRIIDGSIDLAGNYIIGASASGGYPNHSLGIVNFNHASNNQTITDSGGVGANIRIDKTGGSVSLLSDIRVSDWTYIQGTVNNLTTHTITFNGDTDAVFIPGNLTYGNIEISGTNHGGFDLLTVGSGTLNISGNLVVTQGQLRLNTNNPIVNVTGSVSIAAGSVMYAGTNTITVGKSWSNSGTFNHGSGTVSLSGDCGDFSVAAFTPGASTYNNIEVNKYCYNGNYDIVNVSGTATAAGNLVQTHGKIDGGQINLAGDYTIMSSASGAYYAGYATNVNFNNTTDQHIFYSAGGVGAQIRVDKTAGNLIIATDISVAGWTYVQGSITGLDTYTLTLGGGCPGVFVPGSFTYTNLTVNKYSGDDRYNYLAITGTGAVSGNLNHAGGRLRGGQINLAGNYTIGANSNTAGDDGAFTIINFNHASNNQAIVYTAGGLGANIRIDKAGGTFSISSDVTVTDWNYIQGAVSGIDTHNITLAGYLSGTFTQGAINYGSITVNKASTNAAADDLTVGAGTLNISGNLTVTDGELKFNTNNTTVNITGSVSIAAAGITDAGINTVTISGSWTNAGTFNHGNGRVKFVGNSSSGFTPGSSVYNDIELNKTAGNPGYDWLGITGTATVSGNIFETAGRFTGGQMNLAGNYTVSADSAGGTAMINFNHASNNQTIVYTAGGIGAQLRIDKTGGNFTVSDNITIFGWAYIQGTVIGVDTHTLTFGGVDDGGFTPGDLTYSNIELNKTNGSAGYDGLLVSGIATVSGNLVHTDGRFKVGGQINLAGNYTVSAGASGGIAVINFNHGSNNQTINYTAGGIGAQIRIDKTGGTFSIGSDINVFGWEYIQGTITGVNTHTLTLGGADSGSFTPGALTYGNVEVNKTNGSSGYDNLTVSAGTLNISGNFTLTDGDLYLNTNNPTVNVTGNVSIAAAGIFYAPANPITVNGNWTNSGTFNHGNGRIIFATSTNKIFTPGSSAYYNIELNKAGYDDLAIVGTATVLGNITQADGDFSEGQIDLSGNYIIGASANGTTNLPTIINFNHATNNQQIIYSAGGTGASIRVDKAGGSLSIADNITINGWTYIRGTITGLDTHSLVFGDDYPGTFTGGSFAYNNLELNKTGAYSELNVQDTVAVSGNFSHTDGNLQGGQINLAGNYIIGAAADGSSGTGTIINFNHATNSQSIIYSAGGVGSYVRVDKTGGTLTISDDINVNSWSYIQGNVIGISTHVLILGDNYPGVFSFGSLTYGSVEMNKYGSYDELTLSSGELNLLGSLTLTDGEFITTSNPSINLGGNLSVSSLATYTRGTSTITFNGATSSILTDLSATPQNIGNIAVNKTNTTETQNKLTLASSFTCNTLSIDGTSGQADTLDLGNGGYTLTLANAGSNANVFTVNGTVITGDSTIKYAATNSAGNINIAPTSYDNLELSGAETYALSGTTTLAGNLIVGATSVLSAGTNTLNLAGNITNTGTFTSGTSTVNLTGTNQILSGNTTFYNLTKDITTSDTLTFAADSTTTINPSGTLTLKGQDRDNRLSLVSSTPDTQWNLAVNDASIYDFDFLDIQDSDATTRHLSVLNSLDAGNNTNWTIVNNTATGITAPSINVEGSIVTIRTTASDTDHDNISLKIEYSQDNGSTWHDPYLSSVTSISGTPALANTNEYQITNITTASDNTVTILWDTKSEQNELLSILYENDIKIKLTPYDGTDIGSSQTSSSFEVNNRSAVFVPSSKPDLSDTEISSDNDILHLANLPADITQIAISSISDFQDVSYQDITDIINLSDYTSDTIYFKFRTSQGSTSDTITYNKVSHSVSSDLREGDIVKTKDNFDVYIIKYKNGKQYKRLILSPSVFNSYHHLKWGNIKIISQTEMDRYVTSNLVKETIDVTIFELFPNGDTGERRKLDISKPYDIDSVYEINRVDRDSYILVK